MDKISLLTIATMDEEDVQRVINELCMTDATMRAIKDAGMSDKHALLVMHHMKIEAEARAVDLMMTAPMPLILVKPPKGIG